MKFIFKGPLKESIYNLMRQAGYSFQGKDEERGDLSFVRPPRDYPRFHVYLKIEDETTLALNLHLDQKRPIYRGTSAHAGEYENEMVEKEMERVKQIFLC